jgi:adenylosuccinate lyase
MDPLLIISPCDGRYNKYTKCCQEYFSEYAIQKKRIHIEIVYLHYLIQYLPQFENITDFSTLYKIHENFDLNECMKVKEIENTIKHDVKAIEIYIKNILLHTEFKDFVSFIHFGLTSQDINNVLYPLLIKNFISDEYIPILNIITNKLNNMYTMYNSITMLSHTHGQPAVPTTFGKEMKVFEYRLNEAIKILKNIEYKCKFGGAVGNLNAHYIAYPDYDWELFASNFIKQFNCTRSVYTTQIDNYENLSIIFDSVKRINTILIDLCQDIWLYIYKNYLELSINTKEVGSSTMPHKVNPIDFENAEGNLGISNTLFEFMSRKLPISRLQRDLTDSTVLRNIGMTFGYSVISIQNICNGLDKIYPNKTNIMYDLYKNPVVLSEAYQTILRKHNMIDAYDKLKDFTRTNENITIENFHTFFETLNISDIIINELHQVNSTNYIGLC